MDNGNHELRNAKPTGLPRLSRLPKPTFKDQSQSATLEACQTVKTNAATGSVTATGTSRLKILTAHNERQVKQKEVTAARCSQQFKIHRASRVSSSGSVAEDLSQTGSRRGSSGIAHGEARSENDGPSYTGRNINAVTTMGTRKKFQSPHRENTTLQHSVKDSASSGKASMVSQTAFSKRAAQPRLVAKMHDSKVAHDEHKMNNATKQSPPRKVSSSSAAFREQLAKAKAAKRKPIANSPTQSGHTNLDNHDAGDWIDPFGQSTKGTKTLLQKRLEAARVTGRLNISSLGFQEIPRDVLNLYDVGTTTDDWVSSVDLVHMNAAYNEIEQLSEDLFPDIENEDVTENDSPKGLLFRSLKKLELQGNKLKSLTLGMRKLEYLKSLNLSRNQLSNLTVDTVSQIGGLTELKMVENSIEGSLSEKIVSLENMEMLDFSSNKINELPQTISRLSKLRNLDMSKNRIAALPSSYVGTTSLTRLILSNNSMFGTLFRPNVTFPSLSTLEVANNSLTSIIDTDILPFPALCALDISYNKISSIPDLTKCSRLHTLKANENKLTCFPHGFTSLSELRIGDFTGNDIVTLDENVCLMDNLQSLHVAANPLRERKFLTMSTADLKAGLACRLHGAVQAEESDLQEHENKPRIQKAGELDSKFQGSSIVSLTGNDISDLEEDEFASLVSQSAVSEIRLNKLDSSYIPSALQACSTLKILDVSNNHLQNAFDTDVEFPALREIKLQMNMISTFDDVTRFLDAPRLQCMDISRNRIKGTLPVLKEKYPFLLSFDASDNKVDSLSTEALTGLSAANLSRNNISYLPPEIGLLEGSLKSLEVDGNAFRVPNYRVLEKGTAALLAWLRTKIPE